jgi:hypothetical protein
LTKIYKKIVFSDEIHFSLTSASQGIVSRSPERNPAPKFSLFCGSFVSSLDTEPHCGFSLSTSEVNKFLCLRAQFNIICKKILTETARKKTSTKKAKKFLRIETQHLLIVHKM